ncbi:MAG: hypothetical protein DMG34_05560, partial [Acidobacteria bacterium]
KFDAKSAREENHRQQVNRNSSNRTRQIRRGPNGIPVGDKNESSRKAVILIHAQQGNRFTYAGRTTRGDLRGEVVRPELTASVTRSAESGSGFRPRGNEEGQERSAGKDRRFNRDRGAVN